MLGAAEPRLRTNRLRDKSRSNSHVSSFYPVGPTSSNQLNMMSSYSIILVLLLHLRASAIANGFLLVNDSPHSIATAGPIVVRQNNRQASRQQLQMSISPEELSKQKGEALQSLSDFHDGTWSGSATSFSITSDAAAGVTRRKFSVPYRTSVSTRFGFGDDEGLKMTETFTWSDDANDNNNGGDDSSKGEEGGFCVATRSAQLGSSMDVDAVDGSYSTDVALLDLPSAITGSQALPKFAIENCIAVSDDERVRIFLLYGMDDLLSRVVICDEKRVQDSDGDGNVGSDSDAGDKMSKSDSRGPVTIESSMDERIQRLQEAFASSKSDGSGRSTSSEASENEKYDIDLFGLSLGVWLGDTIVRDQGALSDNSSSSSKGFGSPRPSMSKSKKKEFGDGFAEWSMGVQKVSMVFKYDFEETVRQVMVFGRSLGVSTGAVPLSSMGTVNDELMSRRLPPEERMLYIDYDMSRYAAFIVGEKYIKVPRYLSFAQAESFPFFTEVSIFQRRKKDEKELVLEIGDEEELPDAFCSRMTRLYNKDGEFTQGTTSFFMLKQMTPESP